MLWIGAFLVTLSQTLKHTTVESAALEAERAAGRAVDYFDEFNKQTEG